MGRAALITIAVLAGGPVAHAVPALSFGVEGAGGAVWAPKLHWLGDDNFVGWRFGLGLGRFAVLDIALDEDVDRIEPALGAGVRVRPWAGPCWSARGSLYGRAQVALVAASYLGGNYDVTAGIGHWGGFGERAPRLHWYAELDAVARLGEYETLSIHVNIGFAFATGAFWR